MAKKNVPHATAAMAVPVSALYWKESRNFSREKPSTERPKLIKLLTNGWNFVLGAVPVQRIEEVSKKDGVDYVDERVKDLQAQWENLKKDRTPDGALRCQVFEEIYVKDGKIIAPQFMPNACFQRGLVFFDAMVRCRAMAGKEGPDGTDGELRTMIPIMERTYESEADRLKEQVEENELKTEGAQPISDRDRIRTARKFVQLGKNQIFLRRCFKDTTGQKLWGVCQVDLLYPNAHLFDRLMLDEKDPDHVPYGPLKVTELNTMIRCRKQVTCNVGETELTDEDITVRLNNVGKGGGKTSGGQIMKRDEIANMVTSNPVKIIQDCMDAVVSNNSDKILKYMPISTGLNCLVELAALGEYPPVELWLVERLQAAKAAAEKRKD